MSPLNVGFVIVGLVLGILLGLTVLFTIAAVFVFRWCDHIARERGMIDRTTNY